MGIRNNIFPKLNTKAIYIYYKYEKSKNKKMNNKEMNLLNLNNLKDINWYHFGGCLAL